MAPGLLLEPIAADHSLAVENYRVVATLAKCIQETNANNDNKAICNSETCPTMTAGQ